MRSLQRFPLKEESLARAIYANKADYPGELSFEKDDVLRIISQKPEIEGCSEGWWLCVDKHGRRGIAPGNRLQIMQHPDSDGFFRVAQPFMDDFFAFHSSPFEDPFFRKSTFPSLIKGRIFDAPHLRRMNSCDDALKNVGVVRNIPIRVEPIVTERTTQSTLNIIDHFPSMRKRNDFQPDFRQTTFFGPTDSSRHSVESPRLSSLDHRLSSDEEERQSVQSARAPQRTLIIPSAVPGRTIEIPLGEPMQRSISQNVDSAGSKNMKPESHLEKLTQRLKTLAARPFRVPPNFKETAVSFQDNSHFSIPSSSGIGTNTTDSSTSSEENKRASDLLSLSGSENVPRPYMSQSMIHPTPAIQTSFDGYEKVPRKQAELFTEADMRKNETLPWNNIPTTVARRVGEVLEEEIQARKSMVLNKMSDNLRGIESAVNQINLVTAPQFWRVAHILQPNLNSLRDAASTIVDSLESFVDSTGRVAIDRDNPKSADFIRLIGPLNEEKRLLGNMKKAIDNLGWSVANLSRDRDQPRTMDSLEQFVSVAAHVPLNCRRMYQWIQMLIPSSTIIFLSPIAKATQKMQEKPKDFLNPTNDEKRLSSSSTSSTAASVDMPPSILVSNPNVDKPRGKVTFADETTSNSSADNSSLEYSTVRKQPREVKDERIYEEDDLDSVVSDHDSLFQDYAYLDDVVPKINKEVQQNSIRSEDIQIFRFYVPQLEQHTEALSHAIEEFLEVIEKHLPPREFVQKGKMIILAAHKLIYIGDSVSQCVSNKNIKKVVRNCADELCDHLKECVRATKIAAEEFPEVKSMQEMVDTIIAVSKSAHCLKSLIRECC